MMTTLRFGTRERRLCCEAAKVQSAVLYLALLAGILAPRAMAEVQSGIAEVNGTKLYYEMAGSGRVIVLLHGGAVDRRAWDDQFTEFAAKYRVIRYDLRGAGKSASPVKPFSNSEDLYQLLRFLKVDKAYLIGISRGGGIAFDMPIR